MCLPPEIFAHIFSFLGFLPRCSRAHFILSPERLLYANIVLFDIDNRDDDCLKFRAAKFNMLLRACPHIAHYVRKIDIRLCLVPARSSANEIAPMVAMLSHLQVITPSAHSQHNFRIRLLPFVLNPPS
jgi:hypothetical protein